MPARILAGEPIADQLKAEATEELQSLARYSVRPGLAVVLVGNDPASRAYVCGKVKECQELGIYSELHELSASTSAQTLLDLVDALNTSEKIDGFLVQLPLPPHIDSTLILNRILPDKDVDGFHPINAGRLALGQPGLVPCTPAGIIELLDRCNLEIEGRRAVVLGRSNIVGKPVAMLLLQRNATVTICHSRSRDLRSITREADILIVAIGKTATITREFVKPGAAVVDVGMNRIADLAEIEHYFGQDEKRMAAMGKRGWIFAGDVHPGVAEVAGALTPVPGGVGLLTRAMLMKNTLRAARLRRGML